MDTGIRDTAIMSGEPTWRGIVIQTNRRLQDSRISPCCRQEGPRAALRSNASTSVIVPCVSRRIKSQAQSTGHRSRWRRHLSQCYTRSVHGRCESNPSLPRMGSSCLPPVGCRGWVWLWAVCVWRVRAVCGRKSGNGPTESRAADVRIKLLLGAGWLPTFQYFTPPSTPQPTIFTAWPPKECLLVLW